MLNPTRWFTPTSLLPWSLHGLVKLLTCVVEELVFATQAPPQRLWRDHCCWSSFLSFLTPPSLLIISYSFPPQSSCLLIPSHLITSSHQPPHLHHLQALQLFQLLQLVSICANFRAFSNLRHPFFGNWEEEEQQQLTTTTKRTEEWAPNFVCVIFHSVVCRFSTFCFLLKSILEQSFYIGECSA